MHHEDRAGVNALIRGVDDLATGNLPAIVVMCTNRLDVLLNTAFLEAIEFLPRLPVEIFAVHDKHAFLDVGVVLKQSGGLERGERLAAASGVPDIPVAAILENAVHNSLDCVDLIRTHHHQSLLAGNQHHIPADHLTQSAFGQEGLREAVEICDLLVALGGELMNGEKALVSIEAEMAAVVVGEIPSITSIAYDEELHEAEQRLGITIAGVVFVVNNLLHGPTGANPEGFQLYLHHRHTVYEQDDIITMMAVVGVNAELVDDFKRIFAPVLKSLLLTLFVCIDGGVESGAGVRVWIGERSRSGWLSE